MKRIDRSRGRHLQFCVPLHGKRGSKAEGRWELSRFIASEPDFPSGKSWQPFLAIRLSALIIFRGATFITSHRSLSDLSECRLLFQIRTADLRLYRPVPSDHHHNRQHAHRGRPFQETYANSDQRRPDGDGPLRHVHSALPLSVALLHVHLWKPLQAPLPGGRLLPLEDHERGDAGALPHGLHLADAGPGRAKVRNDFLGFCLSVGACVSPTLTRRRTTARKENLSPSIPKSENRAGTEVNEIVFGKFYEAEKFSY